MQIRISPTDGVPIYLQIVKQIKYLVASGRLEADEQLPPVRKLAQQLVVNPNTVARAYRELESDGVLLTRRGSGVYVSDGGSPLHLRERKRILTERIDMLLTEAEQMNVQLEDIISLIHKRNKAMKRTTGGE